MKFKQNNNQVSKYVSNGRFLFYKNASQFRRLLKASMKSWYKRVEMMDNNEFRKIWLRKTRMK